MPGIAIVLHELATTGVARNALAIGQHMHRAGWRVSLITIRGGGDLAPLAAGLDHRVLGGSRMFRKLEMALAIRPLQRQLEALAPDVVLSAGNHAHQAVLSAAMGIAAARRPAVVCRISNDLKHAAGRRNPLAYVSLRRLNARRVVRNATRLVLVSAHLADDPILRDPLARDKVEVIANGVDAAKIRALAQEPCPHPWAGEDVPIVLAVGRIAPQKNFATLIRAFALAREQRAARLVIVGGGKRKARGRLERLAETLGVRDHVAFVGRTPNPFPYFRAATVFALPSVWEGSPNVLLEALACGVPAVASRLAGSAAHVLDDGRYGLLVDPCDAGEMAAGLLAQLDPERQVRPGTRIEAYGLDRTMAQYEALFTELAGGLEA